MGDFYRGTITLPTKYMNPEIAYKFQEEGMFLESQTGDDLTEYSHANARDGEFPELESYLSELGIPFDRYSDSYFEYSPQVFYNRPEGSMTVVLTNEGLEYIPMDDVRKLVAVIQDPEKMREDVLAAVEELLSNYGSAGIKPIEDYV
jgi:hypothetical protein